MILWNEFISFLFLSKPTLCKNVCFVVVVVSRIDVLSKPRRLSALLLWKNWIFQLIFLLLLHLKSLFIDWKWKWYLDIFTCYFPATASIRRWSEWDLRVSWGISLFSFWNWRFSIFQKNQPKKFLFDGLCVFATIFLCVFFLLSSPFHFYFFGHAITKKAHKKPKIRCEISYLKTVYIVWIVATIWRCFLPLFPFYLFLLLALAFSKISCFSPSFRARHVKYQHAFYINWDFSFFFFFFLTRQRFTLPSKTLFRDITRIDIFTQFSFNQPKFFAFNANKHLRYFSYYSCFCFRFLNWNFSSFCSHDKKKKTKNSPEWEWMDFFFLFYLYLSHINSH